MHWRKGSFHNASYWKPRIMQMRTFDDEWALFPRRRGEVRELSRCVKVDREDQLPFRHKAFLTADPSGLGQLPEISETFACTALDH